MDKKKTIGIGVVLVVLLLIVLIAPSFFTGKQKTKNISSVTDQTRDERGNIIYTPSQNDVSGQKIELFTPEYGRAVAKKVLSWLNKTRIYGERLENPSAYGEFICDGGYAAGESCMNNKKCVIHRTANNMGLIATWARYKYYEQVEKDPSQMKIIQSDIATYANQKKIAVIQPAMWNFRVMYDLWSGPDITAEQKKTIDIILQRMQIDPKVTDPVEKEVWDKPSVPSILTFDTAVADKNISLSERDNLTSIFSSEYTYIYLYTRDNRVEKDQPYLNLAVGLYNEAFKRYMISGGDEKVFNPYLFGVAALDLYKATGEGVFLDTASKLADRHIDRDCGNSMILCSTRAYFYHELLKVNTKQEYLRARNVILQKVLSNSYDSNEVDGYRIGKGALYTENTSLDESLVYELVPNSLFVRILIEL